MKQLPDYSEWLTAERHRVESKLWDEGGLYKHYAEQLKTFCKERKLWSIMELGCGNGLVGTQLDPQKYDYYGVDRNAHALRHAAEINLQFEIFDEDIRSVTPDWLRNKIGQPDVDVVCSFAVLKHFGLHEWRKVLGDMLLCGRYGMFSVPIAEEDKDDGTEFHHTWISEATLLEALSIGFHRLIEPMCPDFETETGREHIFFTERVEIG